ncbi:hypothetical protein [Rhodoplanes roseus]|uniref:Uncharacterized protein n=1 Tax=Rhodoplanes roseus TaxID=29409 RepID=A0A327L521_9BRAD|nr:hypothetical protein [Rhodoplanes roseus]RAI45527.1 hypothetical protein CH341_03390 [Rhodoplanes roseus]
MSRAPVASAGEPGSDPLGPEAEATLDRLARAEVAVVESVRQLNAQRLRLAELAHGDEDGSGEARSSAERLLRALETLVALHVAERDRLRRAL